jgi:hypothetical protein
MVKPTAEEYPMKHPLSLPRRMQFAFVCGVACLLLGILSPWLCAQEGNAPVKPALPASPPPTAKPGAKAGGNASLYVGAYSVDHEFQFVTEECMKIIRSKRVLFGSRSWGLQLGTIMSGKDKKYALDWDSRSGVRVTEANRILEAGAFAQPKIVHYVFDMVPRRWAFLDDFIRKDPWKFGGQIDGAFQFLYCGPGKEAKQFADEYFPMLDKLIADYPKIRFAIATHPISAEGNDIKGAWKDANSEWNIAGGDYSEAVIKRYYGKIPILDIRDIVSTRADGKTCTFQHNGKTYRALCPEYNISHDQIHPNSPEARERMGNGFILLLAKMFCPEKLPPSDAPKPEVLK